MAARRGERKKRGPTIHAHTRRPCRTDRTPGGMTKTILLTLGRLPKALELARALHANGCRVIVAEPFGLHLLKASRAVAKSLVVTAPNKNAAAFKADIARIVADEGVDQIIAVSEEVVHVAKARAGTDDGASLLGPSFETLIRLHDKAEFILLAQHLGLTAPTSARADTAAASALLAAGDCVLKPALGCAGAGLQFVDQGEAPPSDMLRHGIVVQQRIRGREVSALAVASGGNVLGMSVYRALAKSGTVAVAFERLDDEHAAEAWVRAFVEKTQYSGFIAFDFIVDATGVAYPLECNPRLTSGVHFFEHRSLARAVLEPQTAGPIAHKPQCRFQEGHTTLALAYASVVRPREFLRRFPAVFRTADVKWSARDPLPFLFFTTLSWPVLRRTIFGGMSLAEASIRDIEWADHTLIEQTET